MKSYSSTDYNYTVKCVCRWVKTGKKIWKQLCCACGLVRISCNCVFCCNLTELVLQIHLGQEKCRPRPPRSTSQNSSNSHSWCKRPTVRVRAAAGTPSLAPTLQRFSSSPQSLHSCLRRKAQLPDRATTDVQALSHPVAVISHSHGHVQEPADRARPTLFPMVGFFPLLLLL